MGAVTPQESPFVMPLAFLRANFAVAKFRFEIDTGEAGPNGNGVEATSRACANGARNGRDFRHGGRSVRGQGGPPRRPPTTRVLRRRVGSPRRPSSPRRAGSPEGPPLLWSEGPDDEPLAGGVIDAKQLCCLVSIRKIEVVDFVGVAVISDCTRCRLEMLKREESSFVVPLAFLRMNFAVAKFRLEVAERAERSGGRG